MIFLKPHKCYLLYSQSAKYLQFSLFCKLGASQLFLLVFWGRDLLHRISCPYSWRMRLSCQGARLNVSGSGLHCVALFCSLRACNTDGQVENSGASPSSPGAKDLCPPTLHRKVVSHACLPGFCPNSLFTQSKTKHFYLKQTTEFQDSKFYRLLRQVPMLFFPGKRGVSHHTPAFHWAPARRAVAWPHSSSQFMPTLSRMPAPRLAVFSQLPTWCLGTLLHLGTTCSSCDPEDLDAMLFPLEFCPALPPEHFSARDVPHCSKVLRVWILCFTAYTTLW